MVRSEGACAHRAGPTPQLQLELQRDVGAPARGRAAVGQRCAALEIDPSLAQSLVLLVSEVITNAVRHSGGPPEAPIELHAEFGAQNIRVTVTDAGRGFAPQPRDPGRTHDGYGLYLLEKVAARWGVEPGSPTRVWFEMLRAST